MLYEFQKDIQVMLAARAYPVRVRYGPERLTRTHAAEGHSVVIEADTEAGDKLMAPRGGQGNPRKPRDLLIGAMATIYARSVLPNAHRGDHERECRKIVDALVSCFYEWGVRGRVGDLPVTKMGFIQPEGEAKEVWPGAVYEIRFGLPRGVYDRTYVGEQNPGAARPTGAATGVANRTEASAPGVDPATGCDST